jgi:hypothetical protein
VNDVHASEVLTETIGDAQPKELERLRLIRIADEGKPLAFPALSFAP